MIDMEHLHLTHTTPDGWQKDSVGHLIVEQPKSPIKVSDAACFGSFPFFTSGDDVLMHTVALVNGDNIYLATGGQANIKHYNGDASYSTDTYVVKTTEDIDTTLLYYYLTNIRLFIDSNYFQGSGLKHLQKKDFKKHELYFPKDIEEQKRIAALLTQIDLVIADTKKLIDKYRNIKAGLMQDLLTKGIDGNGNIRSEETHEFKDSELGRIPVEWKIESLGKNCNVFNGFAFSSSDYCQNGIQLVRMGNLYKNELNLSRAPIFLPCHFQEIYSDFIINKGDIIMSMTGTSGKKDYGFAVMIKDNIQLLLNQRVCKIVPDETSFVKNFVLYLLHTQSYLEVLYNKCFGTKQANLTRKEILAPLIIRPQKGEQQRIVTMIQKIEKFEHSLNQELIKLCQQREGLLKDLLSGNIRIPSTIKL